MKDDIKRLSRLTRILTQLQTKRLITAGELAVKFNVSTRTIYRDIKALEQAGIPILTEDGRGYYVMDGYRIPPVMFTENEANALITAEKLVQKNADSSFFKHYSEAVNKVKAVLRYETKDKANLLSERIAFIRNYNTNRVDTLALLQSAITNFQCMEIEYISLGKEEKTMRIIEPFALYNTQENWVLVAYCRLRNDFRAFRLDRIELLKPMEQSFEPHKMTLQEYFASC